jgi:hypothetical protein
MVDKDFEEITAADLLKLVKEREPEGRRLEYKRELPGRTDRDKKEFLADISAFANAGGGDVIYGIEESDGVASAANGLSIVNPDDEILRIQNMVNNGLDPRVMGLRIRAVVGLPSGPAILVRVPKSWNAPHMVRTSDSRFYVRSNAGKHAMDVREIRAAFDGALAVTERAQRFLAERVGQIIADETPVPLSRRARMILHLLPLESFEPGRMVDLAAVEKMSGYIQGANQRYGRYNFNGRLHFGPYEDGRESIGYTQVFKNGTIEFVDSSSFDEFDGVSKRPFGSEKEVVPWIRAEILQPLAISAMMNCLSATTTLGIGPPYYVLLTLVGVKGYRIFDRPTMEFPDSVKDVHRIELDQLSFPELLVDKASVDPKRALRSTFDALWQASGFANCLNYNDDGEYVVRR